jgi:hypothetical protein
MKATNLATTGPLENLRQQLAELLARNGITSEYSVLVIHHGPTLPDDVIVVPGEVQTSAPRKAKPVKTL